MIRTIYVVLRQPQEGYEEKVETQLDWFVSETAARSFLGSLLGGEEDELSGQRFGLREVHLPFGIPLPLDPKLGAFVSQWLAEHEENLREI